MSMFPQILTNEVVCKETQFVSEEVNLTSNTLLNSYNLHLLF